MPARARRGRNRRRRRAPVSRARRRRRDRARRARARVVASRDQQDHDHRRPGARRHARLSWRSTAEHRFRIAHAAGVAQRRALKLAYAIDADNGDVSDTRARGASGRHDGRGARSVLQRARAPQIPARRAHRDAAHRAHGRAARAVAFRDRVLAHRRAGARWPSIRWRARASSASAASRRSSATSSSPTRCTSSTSRPVAA